MVGAGSSLASALCVDEVTHAATDTLGRLAGASGSDASRWGRMSGVGPMDVPTCHSPTQVGAQPHGPPPRCTVAAFDHLVHELVPSPTIFIASFVGSGAGASVDAYVHASYRAHVPSHGASSYRATRGFALELCGRRWPLGRWLALHGRVAWLE